MRVGLVIAGAVGAVIAAAFVAATVGTERASAQDANTQMIGEIRMYAGATPPAGWAVCNGAELAIAEYPELFAVIGGTYGGGRGTFALPDLRGRMPLGAGNDRELQFPALGGAGGSAEVTLTVEQLPAHDHGLVASGALQKKNRTRLRDPAGAWLAHGKERIYTERAGDVELAAGSVAQTGGGEPHDNMPPFLALHFIIAVDGAAAPTR